MISPICGYETALIFPLAPILNTLRGMFNPVLKIAFCTTIINIVVAIREVIPMTARSKESVEMCPVFAASKILGKRWSILIIQVLLRPEAVIGMRFNELHKELSWISPKVLTQRLRELQESGILTREVDVSSIPPKVWYTLTEKGNDLEPTLQAMQAWGIKHGDRVATVCMDKGFENCHECQH